jgi:hypothetical protein
MPTKLCKSCNREKDIEEFMPKRARRGRYAICRDCTVSRKPTKLSPEAQKKLNSRQRNRYKNLDPKQRWAETTIKNCYARAKTYNLPVDLTLHEVLSLAVDVCPLLGTPIVYGQGKIAPNGPSIDRKDPKQGYTLDNLWVVCTRANRIKNDATSAELFKIAEALQKHGL